MEKLAPAPQNKGLAPDFRVAGSEVGGAFDVSQREKSREFQISRSQRKMPQKAHHVDPGAFT